MAQREFSSLRNIWGLICAASVYKWLPLTLMGAGLVVAAAYSEPFGFHPVRGKDVKRLQKEPWPLFAICLNSRRANVQEQSRLGVAGMQPLITGLWRGAYCFCLLQTDQMDVPLFAHLLERVMIAHLHGLMLLMLGEA